MSLSRLMHESTQYPYNKGYIWPSNREIYQLPINLLYFLGLSSVWLSSNHKFILASIGVVAGLHPKSSASLRKFRAYFRWKRSTLCFWCATSIPSILDVPYPWSRVLNIGYRDRIRWGFFISDIRYRGRYQGYTRISEVHIRHYI